MAHTGRYLKSNLAARSENREPDFAWLTVQLSRACGFCSSSQCNVSGSNGLRPISLGLDRERAVPDVDGLKFLVTCNTRLEGICPFDQTIAREDNPLVCAAYSGAVASCDELRLL